MRATLLLVSTIIVLAASMNSQEVVPQVQKERVQNLVAKRLQELKDDNDIEAIVEFTYILMKAYFTEKPYYIPKVLRLGKHFVTVS